MEESLVSAISLRLTEGNEEMALEPTKHVNGRMWQPGQSGNPNGRPLGSRTVFSTAFCKDLDEVWSEEGREASKSRVVERPLRIVPPCRILLSGRRHCESLGNRLSKQIGFLV
jgi:hypothetical protein